VCEPRFDEAPDRVFGSEWVLEFAGDLIDAPGVRRGLDQHAVEEAVLAGLIAETVLGVLLWNTLVVHRD
jgi:hypothetical protein